MTSFSQLRLTLKKADCLYYEPDYLNHAQEIIFQFLAEKKAIFIREDSQIDFATGNVFSLFSWTSPCLESFHPKIDNIKCVRSMMQTTRKIRSWPRRVGL